jgi:hypothetical protein
MEYFNASELANKCDKSVLKYLLEHPTNIYTMKEDGVWMFYTEAPKFIAWCIKEEQKDSFTAREYIGDTGWFKIKNPSRFGVAFKKDVLDGKYPDIEYAGYSHSERRDLYQWVV